MSEKLDTTWDGLPISPEPPHGTAVIVYKRAHGQRLYLILHRAQVAAEFEGDWAWGPPAGARLPGEDVNHCAERELHEETGLTLTYIYTDIGDADWYVYLAEAPSDAQVILSEEHDRFAWLPAAEAATKCLPPLIGEQIRKADALLGDK